MRRRAGDGCKESSGPRFHRPPRPCDTKVSQGGPEAPPRLRSVDLTTQRAKEKIADSLGTLEAQLRVLGVRTASWVRLVGGLAFLSFAFAFGVLGGRPGWRMVLAPITGYCVLVLLGTVVLRRRGWRWAALPLFVALDLGACFACHLLPLPVTANPAALASLGLGSFVLVVVLASFTVTSAAQLYAAALLAAAAQAVLLHKVGAEPEMVAAASLTLAAVGVLAAFGVRRLQELAARLVAEEAHRGLATEKGLHLEKANGQIALINAELEEQHQRLVIAQREAEVLASLLVHDMKQPLSSVLALLELSAAEVAQLGGSAPLQRDLEMAREQSERLLAMIGDLLAISRLEKGQLEPQAGAAADRRAARRRGPPRPPHQGAALGGGGGRPRRPPRPRADRADGGEPPLQRALVRGAGGRGRAVGAAERRRAGALGEERRPAGLDRAAQGALREAGAGRCAPPQRRPRALPLPAGGRGAPRPDRAGDRPAVRGGVRGAPAGAAGLAGLEGDRVRLLMVGP